MPTMQQTTTQRKNNTMQNRLVASRKFETDSDINRQNILIRTFISVSQSNLDLPDNMFDTKRGSHYLREISLPHKYRIDYLVTTDFGKAVGLVEAKWYFSSWVMKSFEIQLSLLKVRDILQFSDTIGCKPYFIIRLQDGFYYWKVDKQFVKTAKVELAGRTDRGEHGDIEPMISVPERFWNIYHMELPNV